MGRSSSRRSAAQGALPAGETSDLAGFRIHSSTEFSIELEEPVGFFPALLSHRARRSCPKAESPRDAAPQAWIGTGPFRVVSFEPGRRLELERNRTYWRRGYPKSERIVLSFGVTPKEIATGSSRVDISVASDLFPADVEELRRSPEFASGYRETPRLVTYYVAFNTRRGTLTERSLRRRLGASGRRVAPGPPNHRPARHPRSTPDPTRPPRLRSRRPERHVRCRSRRVPRPSPRTWSSRCRAPDVPGDVAAFARELSNAFATPGVIVRPVTSTMAEFLEATNRQGRPRDGALERPTTRIPTRSRTSCIRSHGFRAACAATPETDRIVQRRRVESTPAARHALYGELEDIVERDAMLLPLFHEQAYRIARPEVEGLSVTMGSPTVPLDNLWIRA